GGEAAGGGGVGRQLEGDLTAGHGGAGGVAAAGGEEGGGSERGRAKLDRVHGAAPCTGRLRWTSRPVQRQCTDQNMPTSISDYRTTYYTLEVRQSTVPYI